jgi:hypothetical protein
MDMDMDMDMGMDGWMDGCRQACMQTHIQICTHVYTREPRSRRSVASPGADVAAVTAGTGRVGGVASRSEEL